MDSRGDLTPWQAGMAATELAGLRLQGHPARRFYLPDMEESL